MHTPSWALSFFQPLPGKCMASSVGSDSVPTGMELALFQEYAALTHPQLLDKTGVYVVQPNGLQHHLHHVHKVGKGLLRERFRTYKKMWPDGGKVFACFTVPTATAMWSTERDVALRREQQLIGTDAGLLRSHRYHGEWVDAPLSQIVEAMRRVHVPSEGRFYVFDSETIAVVHQRAELAQPAELPARAVPRRAMPLREAKVDSVRSFFASLSEPEKRSFVDQLPHTERQRLWESLPSHVQAAHDTTSLPRPRGAARPDWLPALYRVAQLLP